MIDHSIGKTFPPAMTIAGYVIMLAGLISLLSNPFVGICVSAGGVILSFAENGIRIDPKEKRYKEYTGLFGIAFGKWKSMAGFTDISVLGKRISTEARSSSNRSATTSREVYFDICVMDKSHRRKLTIKRLQNQDDAVKDARDLSSKLALEYRPYNPEISAKTRTRRR